MLIEVNDREHATILAALRFWQSNGCRGPLAIEDIADCGGKLTKLDEDEIDELCEHINCKCLKEASGAHYWLVYMESGLEPLLHGPYATEEKQEAAAQKLHRKLDEDENLFWMKTIDGFQPEMGTYSGGFFEDEDDSEELEEAPEGS